MAGNRNLNTAAKAKKDKFYTQLEDIENEVHHYKDFFKGKVVLCNCDDPIESQFFVHFIMLFNHYELKKLIITSYADSPIAGKEINLFPDGKTAYKLEIDEFRDFNGDGAENWDDVEFALAQGIYKPQQLTGDEKYCAGDFRSKECIELLKEADVVVTNPPFSVFREFVALLIEYDKKFLIIGNKNALTYKEIFPLIKDDKLFVGFMPMSREIYFDVPKDYIDEGLDNGKDRSIVIHDGRYMARSQSIWFTNIEIAKFREDIPLYEKYSPEKNPRYDNYDAIEVSKTAEIPEDYYGVMGVPITFLEYYDPRQFEVLGCTYSYGDCGCHVSGTSWGAKIKGKDIYKRIFIRRRIEK
ncbi:MAG: modification methylase [Selenomonadaceae bacterium]|nr:modification methylase [Selenomonadaceae bacterium]